MSPLLPLLLVLGLMTSAPAAAKPVAPPEEPAVAPDKPEAIAVEATPAQPGLGKGVESWFSQLSASGVPRWAWGLGGLLGLLLLRRLFRRPQRDDDLMGPPRPARYRDLPRY